MVQSKHICLLFFLCFGLNLGLSQNATVVEQDTKHQRIKQKDLNQNVQDSSPARYTPQELNHRLIFMVAIFLTAALFFLIFYFGFSQKAAFLWLSLYARASISLMS